MASVRPFKKTNKLLLLLFLFVQACLLAYLSWATSPNRTEIGHIGAAAYFWNTGKTDVFCVNPPLVRMAAGIPVFLFCTPQYSNQCYSPLPEDRCEWALGNSFVSINDAKYVRFYVFLARFVCIPFVWLGGYFGYRLAAELYGEISGFVFLILWTFSPLILGWGASICPDVAAASFGIAGIYSFRHWLKNPNRRQMLSAGSFLGGMLLTKLTWIIALPIWVLIWGIWRLRFRQSASKPSLTGLAAVLIFGLYILNAGYFFDGTFRLLHQYRFMSSTLTGYDCVKDGQIRSNNRFAHSLLGSIPVPLPADYVAGLDLQKFDFERGKNSYVYGVWSDRGHWWYYCFALFIKEPISVCGLLLAGIAVSFFGKRNERFQADYVVLLPMLLFFIFVSFQSGISEHVRYVIPVLPMVYVFAAKAFRGLQWGELACRGRRGTLILSAVLFAFVVWYPVSSLRVYPYSLSYFNEWVGGPANGAKYLLGSAVGWGQDEYELRDWVRSHPEAVPLYADYSPSIPLVKLGFKTSVSDSAELPEGWLIVDVNRLYDRDGKYAEYRNGEYAARIGWGIVIIKIKLSGNENETGKQGRKVDRLP